MDTVRIRFLESVTVQDRDARVFSAGEVCELSRASADHWLRRCKAEHVQVAGTATEKPRKAAAKTETEKTE